MIKNVNKIFDKDFRKNPKMYTCGSCGLYHKKVECSGIYHCPNALCKGCGGGWFRQRLKSYEECNDGSGCHTVDEKEWLIKGIIHNLKNSIFRLRFYRVREKE